MKSILLIGLGRFGRHMAIKFQELGHQVLAIDQDEALVNAALPYVTNAEIGDSTNEQYIASLGVRNFDLCVVAIGDNFQSSLETTVLLKDYGARNILARANRDIQAKLLLRNGADHVVYAEKEMAIRSAVKYGSDNVFDYIELTEDHSIYESPVPPSWVGKSIVQINVRQKYHVSILATKRREVLDPLPKPDHVFQEDETLLILGANKDIHHFLQLK